MEGGGDKLPPSPFRKSVPPFPVKLRRLADDPTIRSVRWSPLGVTLLIHQKLLEEELLDSDAGAFKTRMFGSFYRQLNLYGFRRARVNTVGQPEHSDLEATELREFYHMYFQRDHPELLSLVRRPSCSRAALTERRAERIRLMQGPELLTDSCSQQHGKSAHPDRENTQEESTAFSDFPENDRDSKRAETHYDENQQSGPVVSHAASVVSVVSVPMSPPTKGAQPSMENPKERQNKPSNDLPKNGMRSKTTETPRKADRRSSPVIPNVASPAMVVPVPASPPTVSTLQKGPIHDTFGLSLSGYESLWTSDLMVGDNTRSATIRRPLFSSPPRSLMVRPQEFSLRPRVPGLRRNFFGAAVNQQIPGTVGAAANHQIPGTVGAAVNQQIPGTVGAAANHQIPGTVGAAVNQQIPGIVGAAVNQQIPGTVGAAVNQQIPGTVGTACFQSDAGALTRLEARRAKVPPQTDVLQMEAPRIETPQVEVPFLPRVKVPQMGVPYIDDFQARAPQQEVLEVEVPQIHLSQARVQEVDLSCVEAQKKKKLRTKVPLLPVTQVPQLTVPPVPATQVLQSTVPLVSTIEAPQSTVPPFPVTQVPQSTVLPVPTIEAPQSTMDLMVEEENASAVEICARCRRRSGPISEQTEETEAETVNSHVKGANDTAVNEPETESLPEVFIPPPARNGPSLSGVSFTPQPSNELSLTPEKDPVTGVLQVPVLNDPEKPTDSSCPVSMVAGSADPVVMVPDYVAMPTGCPDDVPFLHVANFEEVVTSPCKRQKARDERKGHTEQTSYRCAESEPTIPGEWEFLRHLHLEENRDHTFFSEDVLERPKGKGRRCKKAGKRTRKPSKKKKKEMTHEEEVLAAVRSIEEEVNDEIPLNHAEVPTLQEPQYHEPRTGQEKHGPDVSEVLLPAVSVPLVSYTDLSPEDAKKLPFKKRFHTAAAVQGRPVVQELQGQGPLQSCVDDLIVLGTSITLVHPPEDAAKVVTDENPQGPTAEDEDNTLAVDINSSPTVVEGQIYVPPNQEVTFSEVVCENLEDFDFTVEIVGVDCEISEEQRHQDGQSEAAVRSQTFQIQQEEGHFPQATNPDTQPAVPLISASCEDFVNV